MAIAASLSASEPSADRAKRSRVLLRVWLHAVVVVLFALVMVGGATRLTDSGLSITEWKPIHGVVPPLNDAEWQEEFAKYREIPEFSQINPDMTVEAFKAIFWWEWAHRALARGVGLVFALPLLFFWATGRIERRILPKLLGILALGGLQGAIGWWMVASGLVERVDVSQYRLATHLTIAAIIIAATVTVARGLVPSAEASAGPRIRLSAALLVILALAQIYLGGLVAGLDAGLSYNTWPLMDGTLVPHELLTIEPVWRNFFENPKTVQFMHRCGAYAILLLALWHAVSAARGHPRSGHAARAGALLLLVAVQAGIGIVTLVWQVPLGWALAHQFTALLVLSYAAAHWRAAKGSYPLEASLKFPPARA